MGLATNEALANMLARADTPGMRSFVRSVIQGETLGVSIGQIMRNLAVEMRKRRRAIAEERAQKAPIKILFPLVFLIFPAMFVILLAPADLPAPGRVPQMSRVAGRRWRCAATAAGSSASAARSPTDLSPARGAARRRSELRAGEGLLLRPSYSIHTFFMRFPIDAVFLDRERLGRRRRPKAEALAGRDAPARAGRARAAGGRGRAASTLRVGERLEPAEAAE